MPRYSYLTNCTKYYQSIKLRPRLHLLFSLVMVWSFIIPGPLGPHLITMVSLTTTVLVLRTFWHLPTFTPFSYLYPFFIFFPSCSLCCFMLFLFITHLFPRFYWYYSISCFSFRYPGDTSFLASLFLPLFSYCFP